MMSKTIKFFGALLVGLSLVMMSIGDADARRMGGGKSFGGKGSIFSRSASKPRTPSQKAAFNKNQQARQAMSKRGGMMGMLGGLALGGLLGALFFGGAFENINFMDILLFAGIAFLLYKLFAAKRMRGSPSASGFGGGQRGGGILGGLAGGSGSGGNTQSRGNASGDSGDSGYIGSNLSSNDGAGGRSSDADFNEAQGEREPGSNELDSADAKPIANFAEDEFVQGATKAFEILQRSWNDGDLSEIRGLTTEPMFQFIQEQVEEAGEDNHVEVLNVSGKVLDARELGGVQEATVMFDAVLREGQNERPAQVREIWHFVREADARSQKWYLDGIEQLES